MNSSLSCLVEFKSQPELLNSHPVNYLHVDLHRSFMFKQFIA